MRIIIYGGMEIVMGIFNRDYNKPGKGIDKNAPKKKGLNLFYDTYFRKFWDIIKLNLLFLVTSLPALAIVMLLAGGIANDLVGQYAPLAAKSMGLASVDTSNIELSKMIMAADIGIRLFFGLAFIVLVGAGPTTAGLAYILKCFVNEVPVFLVSDYFAAIKANFKQSLAVWIIDLAVYTFAYYAIKLYGNMPAPMIYLKYVLYALIFFFTILHFFIYHLMVSYKMPFMQLYRNSALFAIPSFPFCLLVFAVCGFILFIFPGIAMTAVSETIMAIFGIATILIWIFLLYGTCGLIIEFNACRQVMKYIKEDHGVEEKENIHSR